MRRMVHNDLDMSRILEHFLEIGVSSNCCILLRAITPSENTAIPIDEPESESVKVSPSKSDTRGSREIGCSVTGGPAHQLTTERQHTNPWNLAAKWVCCKPSHCPFEAAYVVSLEDFIRQAKPANYEQLEKLLCKQSRGREFSITELRELETELASSNHPYFESPTVQPLDLNQFFAGDEFEELRVYWMKWEDVTIPGFVELGLY